MAVPLKLKKRRCGCGPVLEDEMAVEEHRLDL
jgi:hypothetical protein